MFETVVVATDGSESVHRAIAVAVDLAERFDATVHALYVLDTGEVSATPADVRADVRTALAGRGETALGHVAETSRADVVTAVRTGRPAVEIVDYARDQSADLVALGTRGRHGEHRLLLGSVAEDVVRRSPIPVLTVRQLEGSAAVGSADS